MTTERQITRSRSVVAIDARLPATYPFQTRGETSTSSSSQTGGLDLIDDPIVALEDNLLRLVPIAHLLRALEVGRVSSVQILKDAILVLEAAVSPHRGGILDGGQTSHGSP